MLRHLLVDLVGSMPAMRVAGSFASAEEAARAFDDGLAPGALVADILLPGQNGFQFSVDRKCRHPGMGVVLLSDQAYRGCSPTCPSATAPAGPTC
ncbi:MAG TPA: hypothetical protein VHB02_06795 [Acidimicrobiales bacterium]|nr:hypothetical protein [Acidimicrobiales bacterium]